MSEALQYAVAYRIDNGRLEFCLVMRPGAACWEFPSAAGEEPLDSQPLEHALRSLGVQATLDSDPLERFRITHGQQSSDVAVFMAEVDAYHSETAIPTGLRVKWCLAEEARARIRRKPLRRMIDRAAHRLSNRNL